MMLHPNEDVLLDRVTEKTPANFTLPSGEGVRLNAHAFRIIKAASDLTPAHLAALRTQVARHASDSTAIKAAA